MGILHQDLLRGEGSFVDAVTELFEDFVREVRTEELGALEVSRLVRFLPIIHCNLHLFFELWVELTHELIEI